MILTLKQGILGAPREKRGAMVARCVRLLFRVAGRGSGVRVCGCMCAVLHDRAYMAPRVPWEGAKQAKSVL